MPPQKYIIIIYFASLPAKLQPYHIIFRPGTIHPINLKYKNLITLGSWMWTVIVLSFLGKCEDLK